jgi:hypothetical protein
MADLQDAGTQSTSEPKSTAKSNKKRPPAKKRNKNEHRRTVKNFPTLSFEEALTIANAIQQYAAGQPIRRLRLFEHLGKSPDSGPSRQLITNSAKYGLTKGSYVAETLELTPDGNTATSEDATPGDRLKARFRLSVENIEPFKTIYDRLKGNKLPSIPVIRDMLIAEGYNPNDAPAVVDTFIVNAKFLGLLRMIAGAERLVPIEHVLEEVPRTSDNTPKPSPVKAGISKSDATGADWSKICFYITPIGDEGSEHRQHSDLFLNSIVELALTEFGLTVIRADQIGKPGMITGQIIEYLVRSRLVIADLSFHNPNVFYELCLRHVCRLPTVQIIRKCDRIPFDLEQFRTIMIDNSSIYTLVPQLDTYKSEIAVQVRQALENPDVVDNPITVFFPGLRIDVPRASEAKLVTEPVKVMAKAAS